MKTLLILFLSVILMNPVGAQTTDSAMAPRQSITSGDFNKLLNKVRNQKADSLKAAMLRDTFINSIQTVTTAQVRKLLTEISKDSNKLAIVRSAYDRVSDPHLYIKLADLFRSTTYKREFSLWVEKQGRYRDI